MGIFSPCVTSYTVRDRQNFGCFSPGGVLHISNIKIKNIGALKLPKGCHLTMSSTQGGECEPQELPLIEPNGVHVHKMLEFRIPPLKDNQVTSLPYTSNM